VDRNAAISLFLSAATALGASGCLASQFAGRSLTPLFSSPRAVPNKITRPFRPDARIAVLWVGHATVLLQMDDKVFLTDPVFTDTVGELSRRLVEPGIDVDAVPPVDAVVVSHMHFDHYSMGSIDALGSKVRRLVLPEGALVYAADWDFDVRELPRWATWSFDGAKITAVPVRHVGWRYGIDRSWMEKSFSGYVFEYHGLTVYFGGDTGYEASYFRETARRFSSIDLALLPIAPLQPRDFMERNHEDPREAVLAFRDLGARRMVPIHFDTFVNSLDEAGDAVRALDRAAKEMHVDDRVDRLEIGEQRVIVPRGG